MNLTRSQTDSVGLGIYEHGRIPDDSIPIIQPGASCGEFIRLHYNQIFTLFISCVLLPFFRGDMRTAPPRTMNREFFWWFLEWLSSNFNSLYISPRGTPSSLVSCQKGPPLGQRLKMSAFDTPKSLPTMMPLREHGYRQNSFIS